jgi:predicted RNase H-like HicB family nuclease
MKPGKEIHLPVLVELDENGVFIVSCPLYKGCHTYGKTIDEAMNNLKEVVEMCIEEAGIESSNTYVGFRELAVTTHA